MNDSVTLPARPEPLSLVPAQSALVVVDMQNAYASAGGYLDRAGFDVSGAAGCITQVQLAVAAAREAA